MCGGTDSNNSCFSIFFFDIPDIQIESISPSHFQTSVSIQWAPDTTNSSGSQGVPRVPWNPLSGINKSVLKNYLQMHLIRNELR